MLKNTTLKFISIILSLILVIMSIAGINITQNYANASLLTSEECTIYSFISNSITMNEGTADSTSTNKLKYDDRQTITMSSNSSNNINSSINFIIDEENIVNSNLFLTVKSSIESQLQVNIYHNGNLTLLQEINTTTSYQNVNIPINNIKDYCNNDVFEIRLSSSNSSNFSITIDQIIINSKSNSNALNKFTQSYEPINTTIEAGTKTTEPSQLKYMDKNVFSVSSTNNKVAWHSDFIIDQDINNISTIKLSYSGHSSKTTNNIWLSLYNFNTKNWEALSYMPSGETTLDREILISSQDTMSRFISDKNQISIRLYNSCTSSFERHTDYLSLEVFSSSTNTINQFKPNEFILEYGTISSGNLDSIKHYDNDHLKINSNSSNKIAIKTKFNVTSPVNSLKTLTVNFATKNTNNTNNSYLSLYNYTTNSFNVFKTTKSLNNINILTFSLLDYKTIQKYINNNEMIVRIYNSASSSFEREIDYIEIETENTDFNNFTIANFADVHTPLGINYLEGVINEINTSVMPDFSVDLGDMTSHGKLLEYTEYKNKVATLNSALYTIPGNHENRWWNSNGKNDYINQFGEPIQSFDHKGIHFIMLDSSVYLANDGKINPAQQQWIANDLTTINTQTPIIIFGHHPFIINNDISARKELIDLFSQHNLIGYITGHLHRYNEFTYNGIPILTLDGLKDETSMPFITIEFGPRYFYVYKHTASNHTKNLWYTGKMNNMVQNEYSINPLSINNNEVTIDIDIENCPFGISEIKARIDNYGDFTTLTQTSTNHWNGTINTANQHPSLAKGKHCVYIELKDNNSNVWMKYSEYNDLHPNISTIWTYSTNDIIQSSPTYYNGKLYAGSCDKKLYCINATTGQKIWEYETQDQVISKPVIFEQGDNSAVIFGSNDQYLYSLNANTGDLQWNYKTNGSVITDPVINNGCVYFGSGDNNVFSLNASNGNFIWNHQIDGLMRHSPQIIDNVLYACVRNKNIWYALNATTGTQIWQGNANTDDSYFVCGDIAPLIVNNEFWCVDAMTGLLTTLNIGTGSKTWTLNSSYGKTNARSFATNNNSIYFVTNSGKTVNKISAITKNIEWTNDLRYNASNSDIQEYMMDCGLLYNDNKVYHLSERGKLTIFDANTGTILDKYEIEAYPERIFWTTPEINENKFFGCGINGKIYCIETN